MMLKNKSHLISIFIIVITTIIYYPALNGPFLSDDYPNIIANESIRVNNLSYSELKEAVLSSPASKFKRPVSILTFTLNYYFSNGFSNYAIKMTNLMLHLMCGIGFLLLTRKIIYYLMPQQNNKYEYIALGVFSLWLLHPLYVSTVLYAVQRMAILSTFFVVYGCVSYIYLREKLLINGSHFYLCILSIIFFTLAGFFSKENGALLCGFLLLIEYYIFDFKFHSSIKKWKKYLLVNLLVLPVLFIFAYLLYTYAITPSGNLEQYYYSLNDKVLTEFRILWKYVAWLMLFEPESMSLLHDDIIMSKSLFSPVTTIISIILWVIVLSLTLYFLKNKNIIIFGIIWFLWGHILESTVLALVPIYEHRNYLPGFGIILIFSYFLNIFSKANKSKRNIGYALLFIMVFLLPVKLLIERTNDWKNEATLNSSIIRKHPNSPSSYIWAGGLLYHSGDFKNAIHAIRTGANVMPSELAFLTVEASMRCQSEPDKVFPQEFIDMLNRENRYVVATMLLKLNLQRMVINCANSLVNNEIIYRFYKKITKIDDKYIQFHAYVGIGYTLINKGDKVAAINNLNKALKINPEKYKLKEWIRILENSVSN